MDMANESAPAPAPAPAAPASSNWQAKQVYVMAAVCLVVGLAIGYFFRGSESARLVGPAAETSQSGVPQGGTGSGGMKQMPTMDQMQHMAEKKAEPLLEKLKKDPNNAELLIQVGDIYKQTHRFKEAASYYEKSLAVDPKNVEIRTDRASCLYYAGDVDGALAELQQSLKDDPKNANALFNLGMMRWKDKKDASGALAAWKELLKSNPTLDAARKASVQKLITEVQQQSKSN
jgi:cytochrome c-type biogenesis protein CcmH/NrfG